MPAVIAWFRCWCGARYKEWHQYRDCTHKKPEEK